MKEFSSENIATAASFDVDVVNSSGETIGDGEFDLGDDLFPGMDRKQVYSFDIKRNNTKLPVKYSVELDLTGDLFPADGSSPIVLTMERKVNDEWVEVEYSEEFSPENDTESYRVFVEWPHSDNDIDFQGLSGNVSLTVVATQDELQFGPYKTGLIDWRPTPRLAEHQQTRNQTIEFYKNKDGFRVIHVYISDDEEFKTKVGDFTITEYEKGIYKLVSEHDPYTTEDAHWRTSDETIDLSNEGKVIFVNMDKRPLFVNDITIESEELYKWFNQ